MLQSCCKFDKTATSNLCLTSFSTGRVLGKRGAAVDVDLGPDRHQDTCRKHSVPIIGIVQTKNTYVREDPNHSKVWHLHNRDKMYWRKIIF